MEDTIIIKTQYAYMLRADILPGYPETIDDTVLEQWIGHSGCTYYLGKIETGSETGKLHYQLIVWFEQKLSGKEMTKQRNWWRGKCGTHKNNHAFTSARKVVTLASYSTKDLGDLITNLSPEQLQLVPKWQNKKALKENKKEEFEKLLKTKLNSYKTQNMNLEGMHGESIQVTPWQPYQQGNPDFETYCNMLNKAYVEVYGQECCYRNTYFKLAKRHKIITEREFLIKIGVITPNFY